MSAASHRPAAPRLPRRRGRPPPVRLVRRAPRARRLHRHLRAGPRDRRRARLPPRRRRPDPRARRQHGPLPRRQLRLQLRLGGRRRPGPAVPFIDLAWRTIEPNTVGTDEFLQWAEREGIEPMMAVNLGTRGVAAAAALVEYCNGEAGSRWADLRIANGRAEPYGVTAVVPGQRDGRPVADRAQGRRRVRQARRRGRQGHALVDPSIELVVCGSSSMMMDTFGSWEQTVLEHTWDVVDHVSMHAYYEELDGDRASFLGSGTAMDRFIRRVVASADAVAARRRSDKVITISFDEWNVWYLQSRFVGEKNLPLQRDAPRIIEDVYSALDAVVVGDLLVTLLNHADRVPVACLAQLVNVIAPIMTEPGGPAWRQPTFHPFATTARLARGTALDLRVSGPTLPTAGPRRRPGGHRRSDPRRVRRRRVPGQPLRRAGRGRAVAPRRDARAGPRRAGDRRRRARRRGPGARGRRRRAPRLARSTAPRRRPAAPS